MWNKDVSPKITDKLDLKKRNMILYFYAITIKNKWYLTNQIKDDSYNVNEFLKIYRIPRLPDYWRENLHKMGLECIGTT